MSDRSVFRRARSLKLEASILVSSVALNLLAVATPLAVLMIFERVIPHQSLATLHALAVGLVGIAVLEFVLRRARAALLIFAAGRNAAMKQSVFLSIILTAEPERLRRDDPAVHLDRQAAIDQILEHDAGERKTLAIDGPFAAVFVALIGLIGGWLVVVPLTCFALVLAFAVAVKRAQRKIFDRRRSLDGRRYAFLSEVLGQIADIKANTMEYQFARRFEMLLGKTAQVSHSMIRFAGLSQGFGSAIAQISVVATGLLGAYLVMRQQLGLAELAACILLKGRIVQPVTKLLTIWVQSEATVAAQRKLAEIEFLSAPSRAVCRASMRGNLEFIDVRLSDTRSHASLTSAFSAQLSTGETLLVRSEREEYTQALFDTILGQTKPHSGRIYMDGRLPVDWLSHRGPGGIVRLEAKPAIFTGTLMDNVAGFGTGDRIERAHHLAATLGLDRRVRRLPQGYDTPINGGGPFERDAVNRQLIALVRALAMQPKFLLMEEPSAVLDTEERDALRQCLATLPTRPTILMVSPDPRLRSLADKTLILESAEAPTLRAWDLDTRRETSTPVRLRGAV